MKPWLLDTGPIVAYLDSDDSFHEAAGAALDGFKGEFVTTTAVITEVMHFVKRRPRGPGQFADFLEASGIRVHDYCQASAVRRAVSLMEKYVDTPMDFADASLILLGEDLRLYSICTLDQRGFSVFRSPSGKQFGIVLEPFAI